MTKRIYNNNTRKRKNSQLLETKIEKCDININNKFVQILSFCFQINLVDYFIEGMEYYNFSKDINNLRLCCKSIRTNTNKRFFKNSLSRWPNEKNYNKDESNLIHCISFNQKQLSKRYMFGHFPKLSIIIFPHNFNGYIKKHALPPSLIEIIFGDKFNQKLTKGLFPESLERLTFGNNFNQKIIMESLPPSLKVLTFGYRFNQDFTMCTLPRLLEELIFGISYNKQIKKDLLPKSLKKLTFGFDFNQPLIGSFPESLKTLTFGHHFNRPFAKDSLPGSLKKLTFGYRFNQPFAKDSLPGSLKTLTFGHNFNQPFAKDSLPGSLKILTFGYRFNQPFAKDSLPGSLKKLTFGKSFNQQFTKDFFSKSLEEISFGYDFNQNLTKECLPEKLKRLTLAPFNNLNLINPFKCYQYLTIDSLPNSLTELNFGNYDHSLDIKSLINHDNKMFIKLNFDKSYDQASNDHKSNHLLEICEHSAKIIYNDINCEKILCDRFYSSETIELKLFEQQNINIFNKNTKSAKLTQMTISFNFNNGIYRIILPLLLTDSINIYKQLKSTFYKMMFSTVFSNLHNFFRKFVS